MKREASAPAVDGRTRTRGGAADAARAEARDAFARQAEKQKSQKKNPNLYEDSAGNVKARKKPKQQQAKKVAFSPPARGGGRPEDKYGVRNRRVSAGKSNSLSVSRDRRSASSRSLLAA